MGGKCTSMKRKRTSTESEHSTCVTTASSVDTQGCIETVMEKLNKEPLKEETPFKYDKKPIFKKLMERNKAKKSIL